MSTGIQWTEQVWNPVTGCTRVSAGCDHCYAFRLHDQRYLANKRRAESMGFSTIEAARQPDIGSPPPVVPMPEQYDRPFSEVQLMSYRLEDPLHWRKPRHVFVDSMGDLFHEEVPDAYLDRVFAVMALAPQHTFQVLTKRPERMREYMTPIPWDGVAQELDNDDVRRRVQDAAHHTDGVWPDDYEYGFLGTDDWPPCNVWLGTSVEDQAAADERIPLLLQTPASVRFLSCEPLLGPLRLPECTGYADCPLDAVDGHSDYPFGGIDWVIVGGESGPRARPCDLGWIRDIVEQCQAARVPAFVKQLGSKPSIGYVETDAGNDEFVPDVVKLKHGHGGDPAEWPDDLQVRQWPGAFNGGQGE